MNDKAVDSVVEEFTYATSKLDAAAVLSASYRHDMVPMQNLGYIGTAYTAVHEAVELLLKLYLRRGPLNRSYEETHGHDLGKLYMEWDDHGRVDAELAYQRDELGGIKNRIFGAASQAVFKVDRWGTLPPDYTERQTEYLEAWRRYHEKLLSEGHPTVRDVVQRLDSELGAKAVTSLCKPAFATEMKGYGWRPEVWYPDELLSLKWERLADAIRKEESLGLVEAFLKREGTGSVFVGWRYLGEKRLENEGIVFQGPPAKMIQIGRSLEGVIWKGLRSHSSAP